MKASDQKQSEGSLACHTDCDTHTHCQSSDSGAVTTCFYDLGLPRLGFEHPTFRLRGERSNPLCHRCGCVVFKCLNDSESPEYLRELLNIRTLSV